VTDASLLDVCSSILVLLGSLFGDGLSSLRDFVDDRSGRPGEQYKSVEEKRLERFWADYYSAQSRYYADLAKLDWVAYYKNHGTQINVGRDSTGRVQFAPMMVVPRLEPITQLPADLNTDSESEEQRRKRRIDSLAESQAQLWQEFRQRCSRETARWFLEMKLIEAQPSGEAKVVQVWLKIEVRQDGSFAEEEFAKFTLVSGSAQDLVASAKLPATSPFDVAKIGTCVRGRITEIDAKRIRVDLGLENREVENANKRRLVIAGRSYRIAQQVRLGERTKIVLQNDGDPKLWLELKVTDSHSGSLTDIPLRSALPLPNIEVPGFKPTPISPPSKCEAIAPPPMALVGFFSVSPYSSPFNPVATVEIPRLDSAAWPPQHVDSRK
jgi:hypothetical protein